MQFSFALIAALASTVTAANVFTRQTSLPSCALQCIASADFDGCQATDNNCLCRSERFVDTSTRCVLSTCTGDDLQAALELSQQSCAIVGVTLTSTPSLETSTSAPAPTATSPSASGAGAGSSTSASSASAASAASSASSGSPSPSSAASVHGVNAFAGLAALGLAALAL